MLHGYIRVSTSEQANEGTTSLDEQRRVIQGYAMAKGFHSFDSVIYEDAGVSGSLHLKWRKAGYELLEAVKPGDYVVAAKLDRLFRNALDALNIYNDFKEKGIHLVLFDLGVDPVTSENGVSRLIFQIMSAFADHERERIRERMRDGKAAKLAKGGHIGGEAPYGFRIVGAKRESRLEVNEDEQKVIKRVVELKNKPHYFIAKQLNADGFVTRTGRPFVDTQVRRILARQPDVVQ